MSFKSSTILPCFSLILSITALVYLFKIRSDTKEDTFQQPFKPGEKEKLFTFFTNITSADIGMKCELYAEAIMNSKVNKLGDVFYLNIESIHSKSTQLLILFLLVIISLVLTFLRIYFLSKTNSLCSLCFACLTMLGNFGLLIVNFVVFVLFILSFYKGDTQRFIEFLGCVNVNKAEFGNYLFAEKLNKDFKVFFILYLISLFLNYTTNSKTKSNDKQDQNEQKSVEIVETK